MLGSYGPHPNGEAYAKNFESDESPSGMLARSGSYNVRSRVVDDDGEVFAGTCIAFHLDRLNGGAHGLVRLGMEFQAHKGMVNEQRERIRPFVYTVLSEYLLPLCGSGISRLQ